MLTSDVQGLIDVLHEAETLGTRVLIIKGSTAQVRTFTTCCSSNWYHKNIAMIIGMF